MFHDLNGRKIHFVSFGGGPRTLVALPGSIANWEVWLPTVEILSADYRVVCVDHGGVGQSRFPVEEISFELQLEILQSVTEACDLEDFILMADSSNVAVAIEFALRHGSVVDGLVLISGVPWGFDTSRTRRFVRALKADFEGTIADFAEMCFPEDDSRHLVDWLFDLIRRTGPEGIGGILESYYPVDLRDRLSQVDVPSLVVGGSNDRIEAEGPEGFRALASGLADAELVILDGVGHVPIMSQPGEIADLVASFVRRRG